MGHRCSIRFWSKVESTYYRDEAVRDVLGRGVFGPGRTERGVRGGGVGLKGNVS